MIRVHGPWWWRLDAIYLAICIRVYQALYWVSGASPERQATLALRGAGIFAVLNLVRQYREHDFLMVFIQLVWFWILKIQKTENRKLQAAAQQIMDNPRLFINEYMKSAGVRVLWGSLCFVDATLMIATQNLFFSTFAMICCVYSWYASAMPGQTGKSVFSKAKDKLVNALQNLAPLRPIPIPIQSNEVQPCLSTPTRWRM